MKKRERSKRREVMRDLEKLAATREKLAALEPGGGPERPLEVSSASQVEVRATGLACLRCDGALRLVEHRSVPWEALPGQMTLGELGEWHLTDRPERLPLSYTLQARKP